jgi:hypothetical protein
MWLCVGCSFWYTRTSYPTPFLFSNAIIFSSRTHTPSRLLYHTLVSMGAMRIKSGLAFPCLSSQSGLLESSCPSI